MSQDTASFEQALAELEERVRTLEAGEVPLDQALKLFEEGVTLARTCHDQLEAAQQRVATLSRGAKGIEDKPIAE